MARSKPKMIAHPPDFLGTLPRRRGNLKVTAHEWLLAAKAALIEEGIGSVRIDRLARRLKVTRGGFYHYFGDYNAFLSALLDLWRTENVFVSLEKDLLQPQTAYLALLDLVHNLIYETTFDPRFDSAIREWARISSPVAEIVGAVDAQRVATVKTILNGLGCGDAEAGVRAKVFYLHQIGYDTVGTRVAAHTRERDVLAYLSVLCGQSYDKAASAAGVSRSAKRAALTP